MSTLDIENIPLLDAQAQEILKRHSHKITAPAGTKLFEPGVACEYLVLLSKGSVRVQMVSKSGREIVLYRLGAGEPCVMTLSCLISGSDYNGEGIAESDIVGRAICVEGFRELMNRSQAFRDMVFSAYTGRVADLIILLENVAFRSIDQRLAERLAGICDEQGYISRTHNDLALDLGTAREVVSRHLKRFEKDGFLKLTRGKIQVIDATHMRSFYR